MKQFNRTETASRTEELFLICARNSLNGRLLRNALDLTAWGIDWEYLKGLSTTGGVIPPVYAAIKRIIAEVPVQQHVMDWFKTTCLAMTKRAMVQHNELSGLLDLLYREGVKAVPLKGTFLSRRFYGDIAWRGRNTDMDLLIDKRNKSKACVLLEERGYALKGDAGKDDGFRVFIKPKTGIVDLHWNLKTHIGDDEERVAGLLSGTREVAECGIRYRDFNEEELLLFLTYHLVESECFRRLRSICDIAALLDIRKGTLAWNNILGKAEKWRLSNSLYTALRLAEELMDAEVPDWVMGKLKPSFCKRKFIAIFANRDVILRHNSKRRRLLNRVLKNVFFGLVEARAIKEYMSMAFPDERILMGRGSIQRLLTPFLKAYSRN